MAGYGTSGMTVVIILVVFIILIILGALLFFLFGSNSEPGPQGPPGPRGPPGVCDCPENGANFFTQETTIIIPISLPSEIQIPIQRTLASSVAYQVSVTLPTQLIGGYPVTIPPNNESPILQYNSYISNGILYITFTSAGNLTNRNAQVELFGVSTQRLLTTTGAVSKQQQQFQQQPYQQQFQQQPYQQPYQQQFQQQPYQQSYNNADVGRNTRITFSGDKFRMSRKR